MSKVASVSLCSKHTFSKETADHIQLLAGLGVEGDAHCGVLVKHRYHVRKDPTKPNLCQVHLLHAELFSELALKGISIAPGDIGENITTTGIDLLNLPTGAHLRVGDSAVIRVTGLRNPCVQMNGLRPGLMQAVIERSAGSKPRMKAGIMGIVVESGVVRAGDPIRIELPPQPWQPMACV